MSDVVEEVRGLLDQAEKDPRQRGVYLDVASDQIALALAQANLAERMLREARKVRVREPAPIPYLDN